MPIITFDEALQRSTNGRRHLLLGNGFSIAWGARHFSYSSLIERANFSGISQHQQLFTAAGSNDFEAVIRGLRQSARYVRVYLPSDAFTAVRMEDDAETLKSVLLNAIAENHPDRPNRISEAAYASCRSFLNNFQHIYTLNYDLLLYWALMQDEVDDIDIPCDDGFRHPDGDEETDYVAWEDHQSATVHFLHGALHLFDSGDELQKYTWRRTQIPLIEQIRTALADNIFPMFVAEGSSDTKLTRINHHAYLHKALRSFSSIRDSLFIFGHSLAMSDEHILRRIEKGFIRELYVSIYGGANSAASRAIIHRAREMAANRAARAPRRPLDVNFYDSASARVWG